MFLYVWARVKHSVDGCSTGMQTGSISGGASMNYRTIASVNQTVRRPLADGNHTWRKRSEPSVTPWLYRFAVRHFYDCTPWFSSRRRHPPIICDRRRFRRNRQPFLLDQASVPQCPMSTGWSAEVSPIPPAATCCKAVARRERRQRRKSSFTGIDDQAAATFTLPTFTLFVDGFQLLCFSLFITFPLGLSFYHLYTGA